LRSAAGSEGRNRPEVSVRVFDIGDRIRWLVRGSQRIRVNNPRAGVVLASRSRQFGRAPGSNLSQLVWNPANLSGVSCLGISHHQVFMALHWNLRFWLRGELQDWERNNPAAN
jgi:hypothetical protein